MTQGKSLRITEISKRRRSLANPLDARQQARFFKTGRGQYGEGDRFLGIRVPVLRKLAKQYADIPLQESIRLLQSPLHEQRLLALLILIRLYQRTDEATQKGIYRAYLNNTAYINNWDLVDVSADKIVGDWLFHHPPERVMLEKLARSRDLWRRRIAVMATFYFIRQGVFSPTLQLAALLINDRHVVNMPRTMLRYAIEKFPPALRQHYLKR